MSRVFLCIVVLLLLLSPACNQQFDPREEFQRKLVVFSILSTDRNMQFARVEQDYMPADYNPSASTEDKAVSDAIVILRDGNTTYRFADTMFARTDTSRYTTAIRSYVLRGFIPGFGKTYQISASSLSLGTASATVTVPTNCLLDLSAGAMGVLDNPASYIADASIPCYAVLSSLAKGYIGRLYVDYDVLVGSEWQEGRAEIPLRYLNSQLKVLQDAVFPQLTSRPTQNQVTAFFKNDLYRAVLSYTANDRFKGKRIIFKRAVFHVTQVDGNLFSYYNLAHAYLDARSMRLDEPMYSNISGGYGLVGAYTLDSLVHSLPENFSYNSR